MLDLKNIHSRFLMDILHNFVSTYPLGVDWTEIGLGGLFDLRVSTFYDIF